MYVEFAEDVLVGSFMGVAPDEQSITVAGAKVELNSDPRWPARIVDGAGDEKTFADLKGHEGLLLEAECYYSTERGALQATIIETEQILGAPAEGTDVVAITRAQWKPNELRVNGAVSPAGTGKTVSVYRGGSSEPPATPVRPRWAPPPSPPTAPGPSATATSAPTRPRCAPSPAMEVFGPPPSNSGRPTTPYRAGRRTGRSPTERPVRHVSIISGSTRSWALASHNNARRRTGPSPLPGTSRALATLVAALATVLITGEVERVKRCPAEDCGWVFWDSTKNRSRRWCSMRVCGNRNKARTFASRNRPSQGRTA